MAKHSKGSALELNWPGHTQQPWLTVMAYGYGDGQLRDAFSTMQDPLCQTWLLLAAAGSSAATGALGREPSNEDLLERWWSTIKLLLLKWNKAKIWHSTSACSRENCWAWLWFWQSLGHKLQAASYPQQPLAISYMAREDFSASSSYLFEQDTNFFPSFVLGGRCYSPSSLHTLSPICSFSLHSQPVTPMVLTTLLSATICYTRWIGQIIKVSKSSLGFGRNLSSHLL